MARRSDKVIRNIVEHNDRLAISTITLMELTAGAEKSREVSRNLADLAAFSARLEVLPFDAKAATHAGQVKVQLERKGTPIGAYDLLIAGHARAEGLVLVSNNLREFKRVEGLRVENWV